MPADDEPARPAGRDLPDPGFAGDSGEQDPAVATALRGYDEDLSTYLPTLALLQRSRVLAPVVAVLGEVEYDEHGHAHDKTSDMAAVLLTGADGRKGLLAFTGMDALRRWDPQARPVPVGVPDAARAARQDGADALVVDVAGPVTFAIERAELQALADGLLLVRVPGAAGSGWGWARPSTAGPDVR